MGLLNVDGYYDCLLALFDKGVEEGFIEHSARHIFVSANNPAELLQKMEANTLLTTSPSGFNVSFNSNPIRRHSTDSFIFSISRLSQEYAPIHEGVASQETWHKFP